MNEEQYWVQIKKVLGLRQSNVSTVFFDSDAMPYNVVDPKNLTPEQRAERIEKLKERMGIGWTQN
jgi:hypothetical protein